MVFYVLTCLLCFPLYILSSVSSVFIYFGLNCISLLTVRHFVTGVFERCYINKHCLLAKPLDKSQIHLSSSHTPHWLTSLLLWALPPPTTLSILFAGAIQLPTACMANSDKVSKPRTDRCWSGVQLQGSTVRGKRSNGDILQGYSPGLKNGCMVVEEKMTLVLTWCIHLVNILLMSLWPQSQVSRQFINMSFCK